MKVPGTVETLVRQKPQHVWTATPETTVFDAISMLAEKNVGALPVLDKGQLVGILSERDYTRKVILKGKASKTTLVSEIMISPVVTVGPKTGLEECMHLMSDKHIRHLPVIEDGQLVGLISIGDVVNWVISQQEETIRHLTSYISGGYPACE
jgi:CBS domain-containing protein